MLLKDCHYVSRKSVFDLFLGRGRKSLKEFYDIVVQGNNAAALHDEVLQVEFHRERCGYDRTAEWKDARSELPLKEFRCDSEVVGRVENVIRFGSAWFLGHQVYVCPPSGPIKRNTVDIEASILRSRK